MSSSSAELQKLVFDTLTGNADVMALAGGVYDAVPASPFGGKTAYISFGPQDGHEDDAECISGLEVTLQVDIWSRAVGAVECKRLTDLVRKALHRQSLSLEDNALVDSWVALHRVFRDPDGATTHGVVQVTFRVEEPEAEEPPPEVGPGTYFAPSYFGPSYFGPSYFGGVTE